MAFSLEPFFELSRFRFHIPSYQRGYRWEKDQIVALLDDLKNFYHSNTDPKEYYSLQPIVVVPMDPNVQLRPVNEGESELKKYPDSTEFLVIDGQQRLTTLFLLIEYLNSIGGFTKLPQYSLHFDQRQNQDNFMSSRTFSVGSDETYLDNIDNYYLRRAYDAIKNWFTILENEGDEGESAFIAIKKMLNKKEPNTAIDLRIIWYELPLTKVDPIEEFDNINYGSIRLTGTELVKAMLLARDGKNDHEIANRGHAWDQMEKSLQDPMFWSMLKTAKSGKRLSHIEFILDIVADNINNVLPKDYQRKRDLDKDEFDYNVINTHFKIEKAKGRTHSELVTEVWGKIEDTFNRVRNWYDNPMWFHYIGLWRRLRDQKKDSSSKIVNDIRKLEEGSKSKSDFEESLREKVGGILKNKIEHLLSDEEKKDNLHPLEAHSFSYGNANGALINMLLCFNVMTLAGKSGQEQIRFPFHLYDEYNITSLEHIYPQNLEREEMTPGQIKALLDNYLSLGIKVENKADLEELLDSDEWDNDKLSEGFWNQLEPFVSQIERELSKKTGITSKDLHSIANMALVDQPTNSALSNSYLHQKREILKMRNQARLDRKDNGTYLMPATELVFAKHYTPSSKASELRFWTKDDRDAYLGALKSVYDHLTRPKQ